MAQGVSLNVPIIKGKNQTLKFQECKSGIHADPNKKRPTTFGDEARNKLRKIYQAIGITEDEAAIKALDLLTKSWSLYDARTKWINNLTGDRCPLEFSLTFKEGKELPTVRFLIEPQEKPFTLQSSWKAGMELKEKLKELPNVDVSKLQKVYPIFSPSANSQTLPDAETFVIWYAADLEEGHSKFKVYLNPRLFGGEIAPELTKKALNILDAEAAWNFLYPLLNGANSGSRIAFFSVDLVKSEDARIKIYVANKLVNPIEKQLQKCSYYKQGTASSWIKTLIGKREFFNKRPILVTFNFTPTNEIPVPTIHIPIDVYVENDSIIIKRLNSFLSPNQIDILTRVISCTSKNSLQSTNFLTYVSFRPTREGKLDITCYLAL